MQVAGADRNNANRTGTPENDPNPNDASPNVAEDDDLLGRGQKESVEKSPSVRKATRNSKSSTAAPSPGKKGGKKGAKKSTPSAEDGAALLLFIHPCAVVPFE